MAVVAVALFAAALPVGSALASGFGATTLNPNSQSCDVGSPCTVDLVFTPGDGSFGATIGVDIKVTFDPALLQVTSITGAGAYPTEVINTFDNTLGVLQYKAEGAVQSGTTIATVEFSPIAAGTSPLALVVNQNLGGTYYGVNGLAVDGSITSTVTLPTQTLSILGGSTGGGGIGVPDANTDWSQDPVAWDAGISTTGAWHFTGDPSPVWQTAYLVGSHPWGFVPGTDSWINCGPTNSSGECGNALGTVVAFRTRFSIPADAVNPTAVLWINSDNAGTYYLNGTQITDRLVGGGGAGATPVPESAPGVPGVYQAILEAAIQPGVNEMLVIVEDWGGAAGFNYRADITVQASEPPVIIPPKTATTTTVTFGAGPFVYNGSAFTATATVAPDGGTADIVYSGDCVNAGNTCTATATYAGDDTHDGSTGTATITIEQAPSVTTITGDGTFVYDTTAHPLTATVTGAGGLNAAVAVTGCGPAPTDVADSCVGEATYPGDANHLGSSDTGTVTITPAPSTTTVSGGGSFTYDGSGHPLTATVTGVGGLNEAVPVVGCGPNPTLPADSCTGTATFPGDANHLGSSDSASVTITIDYVYPAGGVFVVGDQTPHGLLSDVTFWSSQWSKRNALSGGGAPSSFKGFENTVAAPSCGSTWTTTPGNSAGPPATLGEYVAIVVASNITKKGSTITGNVTEIIVVKTDSGYGPNPGHAGTGTVLQVLCSAS